MEKQVNVKMILALMCAVMIIMLTVAFAHFSRMLKTAGNAAVDPANFDIHFINLSNPEIKGGASVITEPTLSNEGASINDIEVNLKLPGDSVTYTVDIVNTGDINTKISNIEKEIDCNQMSNEDLNEIFEFSVYYTDTETQLQLNDELQPSDRKNITIKIKYKDIEDPDLLPSEALTIDLSYSVTYEQSLNRMVEATYESGLPKTYTPLEYLESTGTQYIDTEFVPSNKNITINTSIMHKDLSNNDIGIFGNIAANVPRILLAKYSNKHYLYSHTGTSKDGLANNNSVVNNSIWYEIVAEFKNNTKTLAINGDSVSSAYNVNFESGNISSISLFKAGPTSTSMYLFNGKMKHTTIYQNNELVRDLIPALDENGRPCMYDTVTKRPFYNSGTGEFLCRRNYSNEPIYENGLPRIFTELDYLESTGTQYIDTEFVPSNKNITINTRIMHKDLSNNDIGIFGNIAANVPRILLGKFDNKHYLYSHTGTSNDGSANNNSVVNNSIWYEIDAEFKNNTKTLAINGDSASSAYNVDFTSGNISSISLFKAGPTNSSMSLFNGKMKHTTIYQNNELVRDLIPALDENNRPCMYDTVTKTAYYSMGTEEFLYSLKDTNE